MVVLIARFARMAMALLVSMAVAGCGGGSSAPARPVIGVSMAHFDDNWLTILRTAMVEHAAKLPGDRYPQFADAQGDVGRQLSQIQNFAAQDAAAIIVNAADTSATPGMTKIARDAGVPARVRQSAARRGDAARGRRVRRVRRPPGRHAGDGRARPVDELPRERRHHGRRARVERRAASHDGGRERRREVSRR